MLGPAARATPRLHVGNEIHQRPPDRKGFYFHDLCVWHLVLYLNVHKSFGV